MNAIYEYIADILKAPDTAIKQYDRIADAIESLNAFPARGKLFESPPERDLGMKQLLVDNYSVVYVLGVDCVTVLRVLYSASDIMGRLRNG